MYLVLPHWPGEPIGGWSLTPHSPSTAGWLSHHFSHSAMERSIAWIADFLKNRLAYPWIRVAQYFELFRSGVKTENGNCNCIYFSREEINDNRIDARFQKTTFTTLLIYGWRIPSPGKEMAELWGLNEEAGYWVKIINLNKPKPAVNEGDRLMITKERHKTESHRHFSHLLSFHPFWIDRRE